MATAENQVAGHNANDFPFVSQEEYEDYVENGMEIENIKAISKKREKEATVLVGKFDINRFPLLEEGEYKDLVLKGNSLSKIDGINKEREESLKKFGEQFSLKVNQQGLVSNSILGICMMGLSGEGKSATGNLILGENTFLPQSGELQIFERKINGLDVFVAEMPGSDQSIDDSKLQEKLNNLFKRLNVFLFVVNISNHRDLAHQTQIWNTMKIQHGNKFVAHCILVLTHAETTLLGQAPDLDSLYSLFTNDPTNNPFGQVMHELYPRIIALDNKTQDYHKRRIQQEVVLNMVREVSDYNRVPYEQYTVVERSDIPSLSKDTGMIEGNPKTTPESTRKAYLPLNVAFAELMISLINTFHDKIKKRDEQTETGH